MRENWYLEIDAEMEDLEKITSIKLEGKIQFLNLNERFFIRSDSFEQCKNLEDVLRQGEEIVKVINGIAEVNLNLSSKISILGATKIDSETQDIERNYGQSSISGELCIVTDLNDSENTKNSLENWFRLSEKDENVRKVFTLLNYGLDSYFNMYRIYEIIKNDLGKTYLETLKVNKEDIERFTGTANRPDASGELARHGYMAGSPMNKPPMNLNEAYRMIYNMIYRWIHYKIENNL